MKRFLMLFLIPLTACTLTDSGKTSQPGAASSGVRYICESGKSADVHYGENGLSLRYRGKTHHLKIARSASGARYVGDGLVWWNKGNENTLFQSLGEEDTGDRLDSCKEAGNPN